MDIMKIDNEVLVKQISELLENARKYVANSVNTALIETYWNIGKLIYEKVENQGVESNYAKETIKNISKSLLEKYGKGFSKSNLYNMLIFYKDYRIFQTVSGQLSWSHYIELIQIDSEHKRPFLGKRKDFSKDEIPEMKFSLEDYEIVIKVMQREPRESINIKKKDRSVYRLLKKKKTA